MKGSPVFWGVVFEKTSFGEPLKDHPLFPFCNMLTVSVSMQISILGDTKDNLYINVSFLYIGILEDIPRYLTKHLYTNSYNSCTGVESMVILYDRFNLSENIFEIIFATDQQTIVAKELIKYLITNQGEVTKSEMSIFATKLHEGQYECILDEQPYKGKRVKLSYNKRQFYDRILTPMKAMGLIDYDLYKKTYKLSTKFTNDLMKIGLMWKTELRKLGIEL